MKPRPAITIRHGTAADAETIHAALLGIARAVGELHKIKSTPDDIRRHGFGDRPAFETLIAEAQGETAGLCLFFPSFSTWRGCPGAYVQDLYVEDRFRGLGIGARLIRRTAALVRARGGRYLRLSVDTMNLGAQEFYMRLGLVHSASEQIHAVYDSAFDALADADRKDS